MAESCGTLEPPEAGRGGKRAFPEPPEEDACSQWTPSSRISGSGLRRKASLKVPAPGPPSHVPCELGAVPMSPA